MGFYKNIETFNTHSLGSEQVLHLVTGREDAIKYISDEIKGNVQSPQAIQHLALIGPRGVGKSFLLRYFQIVLAKQKPNQQIDYVLFPEEQLNIRKPSDFIYEILAYLNDGVSKVADFNFADTEEMWGEAVHILHKEIDNRKKKYANYLLVVAVENIDVILEQAFGNKIDESRFRKLLSSTQNFMILGASLHYDIDKKYNKRFFHGIQKFELKNWDENDFVNYFEKRLALTRKTSQDKISDSCLKNIKNKLRAISVFSGGSPRVAIVLTNLIFTEDFMTMAETLNKIIEDFTVYYQTMIDWLPPKSQVILDALIRKGENLSQSELAEIVNTKQSAISQAFKILKERNIVVGHKVKGEKQYRYSVSDRIMTLFYYKRYINKSVDDNPFSIYTGFLNSFYEKEEIKQQAVKLLEQNKEEGKYIAEIFINMRKPYFIKTKTIKEVLDVLNNKTLPTGELIVMEESEPYNIEANYKSLLKEMRKFDEYKDIMSGSDFVELLDDSAFLSKEEKLEILGSFINGHIKKEQWTKVIELLGKGNESLKELTRISPFAAKMQAVRIQQPLQILEYEKKLQVGKKEIQDDEIEMVLKSLIEGIKKYASNEYFKYISFLTRINISNYLLNKQLVGKAVEQFKEAYKISIELKDIENQVWLLELLGSNYKKIRKHKKAIEYHQKAYEIEKDLNDLESQQWNLAHIIENTLYINSEKAFDILFYKQYQDISKSDLFKEIADAVYYQEKWEGRRAGFKMANFILSKIESIISKEDIYDAIKNLFVGMLNMKVSDELLKDICYEVKGVYSEKEDMVIDAVLSCVAYKESKDKESFLQKLHPDLAMLVKAIVKDSEI